MTAAVTHSPPFVVDYRHEGREFSFILLGPASWADAEAHLASIRASAMVKGSDVVELDAAAVMPALDAWTAIAEALLAAFARAGQPQEMALAGSAVAAASYIACGFDRDQATTCAATVLDAAYAPEARG